MTEEVQQKKSKLPLILAAGALVLAAAGGGWWYLEQQKAVQVEMTAESVVPTKALVKKPVFLPLTKFVLSVKGDDRLHYLMLELSIMSYQEASLKELEDYMPVIRNAVITKLSEKHYKDLAEQGSIATLQTELRQHLVSVMSEMSSTNGIDKVLITKMVVQ